MTVTDALLQIKLLQQKQELLNERIVRLKESAEHTRQQLDSSHGGASADKMAEYIVKLEELYGYAAADLIAAERLTQAVEHAVAALPSLEQTIIIMHWLRGMTWKEVAAKLHYHKDYCRHVGYAALTLLDNLYID